MSNLSVNTNASALIALQNLNKTNSELSTVQSRINTGLKVASAKDNGSIWAIAQNQRAESMSLNAVRDSLERGTGSIDVALAAGGTVSDLLLEMKAKALAASDISLDASSRAALNEDFVTLRDQIAKAVSNAEFNGVNLLNGSLTQLLALANADGTSNLTARGENLSLGGTIVTVAATASISSQTLASGAITSVGNSIQNVSAALARLGSASKAFSLHLTFIGKLQDTIDSGIGNLVDADLAKESARLQALQTKQQLGVQALSIANQTPQILAQLFSG